MKILQAPWVLFFDGASRKPEQHAALGFVLKNSKGQVVQEGRRYLGGGISSELAKYKSLIAGLKKAKSLQVKHLLVKGNSSLLVNQVVGRCTVRDAHLRDHLKKVWLMSKEFDSVFMEFIPKDQNVLADGIANVAIDKELQIQQVVSEYFDRCGAWPAATPNKSPAPIPFSSPKLRSLVSSLSPQRRSQNLDTNKATTISAGPKPLSSALKASAPSRSANVVFQASMSNSELKRTMINCSKLSDSFWHEDLDRLSISDESSITESEEERCFKQLMASSRPEISAPPAATTASSNVNMACNDNVDKGMNVDNGMNVDSSENEAEFSKPASSSSISVNAGLAPAPSSIQLSEADYDRVVTAVISRLKNTKLADDS